jgi:hypothetical protein
VESLVRGIVRDEQHLYTLLSHELDHLEIWSIGDSRLLIKVDGITKVCIASPATQTADEIKRRVKRDELMFAETNLQFHEEYDQTRV